MESQTYNKSLLHLLQKKYDKTSDAGSLTSVHYYLNTRYVTITGPRNAVGGAGDPRVRGPKFDTRSGHILSFLLPLFQEGQLSVTGESMFTKYWLTA